MARTRSIAVVTLGALIAFALSSSNGTAARGPVSVSDLAPADEYFGRARVSPLGLRHKIFSLKDDLHHARLQPDAVQHDAESMEEALLDWIKRFPHDPWLPPTAWNLAILYEELPGAEAQSHALALLRLLRDRYPDTQYADNAARDLERGVGVRPWPKWAARAPADPTAAPAPVATAVANPLTDPKSLVDAILALNGAPDDQHRLAAAQTLEQKYWQLSRNGGDAAYARAAWELACAYERLPGDDAQTRAIKLLALLVDRYSSLVYGRWAIRDLKRGIGARPAVSDAVTPKSRL
jgi:hypothetical protein